ncbi:MAG: hypothetical protein U0414_08985 [Polyangiaceae bacterium]
MTDAPTAPKAGRRTAAHRVVLAWGPRADRVGALAGQLLASLEWLRSVPPLDGKWIAIARLGRTKLPCGSETEAVRSLGAGAHREGLGIGLPEFFKQTYYLGSPHRYRARIELLAGAATVSRGIQAPNRFDLSVRAELSIAELRQTLVGLVNVYRPAWAVVGAESFPRIHTARGTPPVGWITYFSSWFGPPPALAEPSLVTPLGRLGWLVQAFPSDFDASDAEQRRALLVTAKTLRDAGVLKPFEPQPSAAEARLT